MDESKKTQNNGTRPTPWKVPDKFVEEILDGSNQLAPKTDLSYGKSTPANKNHMTASLSKKTLVIGILSFLAGLALGGAGAFFFLRNFSSNPFQILDTSDRPTQDNARLAFEQISADLTKGNGKLQAFKQTNGVLKYVHGVPYYIFEYEAEIFYRNNGEQWVEGVLPETGDIIRDTGGIEFEKAEQGWRFSGVRLGKRSFFTSPKKTQNRK